MPPPSGTLQVKGLAKRQLAQVTARARQLGMTPERYLKHLLEEDLATSQEAKTTTFDALMAPGRAVDEEEVDRLVEAAKVKYYQRASRRG
jgi:hypothetical protein